MKHGPDTPGCVPWRVCLINQTPVFLCTAHLVYICGQCWEEIGDYSQPAPEEDERRQPAKIKLHGCMVSQKSQPEAPRKKGRRKRFFEGS